MRRAALLLAVLTSACAATPTPSRDELAQALKERELVEPTDITHIACQAVDDGKPEVACRWRQRQGRDWQGWQSHLALTDAHWHLVDPPTRRP